MDNQPNNQEPINKTTPVIPAPSEPAIQEPTLPTLMPEETTSIKPEPEVTPEPILSSPEPSAPINPEPEIIPEPINPPAPEPELPPVEPTIKPEQEIENKPEPTLADFGITPKPPQNNFFKVFFIITLIIFIFVAAAFAFVYLKTKNGTTINNQSSLTSPTPTTTPSGICSLNEKTYNVGESFASADGCNTCSCTENKEIVCTEKACLATSSATVSTSTATASSVPKDWKTYTNSAYKFSLNYPNDWSFKESISASTNKTGDISFSSATTKSQLSVSVITDQFDSKLYPNMTFEDFLNKYPGPVENYNGVSNLKKINTQNGTLGYQITYNATNRDNSKYISLPVVYFKINDTTNNYIEFILNDSNYIDSFNKIISTFKFN